MDRFRAVASLLLDCTSELPSRLLAATASWIAGFTDTSCRHIFLHTSNASAPSVSVRRCSVAYFGWLPLSRLTLSGSTMSCRISLSMRRREVLALTKKS